MTQYYKRITGSVIQGNATTVTEPLGTLVVTNDGELRLHDGTTAGGNAIGAKGDKGDPGLVWRGEWQQIPHNYVGGQDVVSYNGSSYIKLGDGNSGSSPDVDTARWAPVALKGADGSGGGGSGNGWQITSGSYSVSVADSGVVTMATSRGNIEFGALPEPGGPSHFHIMKAAGDNNDLYFGDDFNYVLQRGPGYNTTPGYGVEIGANDKDVGSQQVWRFGTDGGLTLPSGLPGTTSIITSGGVGSFGADGIIGIGWSDSSSNPTQISAVTADGNRGVVIQAGAVAGGPPVPDYAWTFGTDGTTTLASGVEISNTGTFNFLSWNTGTALIIADVPYTAGSYIYIPSSSDTNGSLGIVNTNTAGSIMLTQGNGNTNTLSQLYVNNSGTTINNILGGISKTRKLGTDGLLTLPNSGLIDFNSPYTRLKNTVTGKGAQLGSPDDQNYVNVDNTAVTIQVNSDGVTGPHTLPQHNWIFGQDGTIVSETGRNITGELSGQTDNGNYFSNQPIAIKNLSGYKRLLGVTNSAQTWLNLTDVGTQLGINPVWIMGMVIDYQAQCSNFSGGSLASMVGQIIIASSNLSSRDISVTHSEAVCLTGNNTVPVFSALDLWHANGYALQAIRTDTNSQQLDIIWTAKVFINASEDYC
jgi:hypothetical protein